MAKATAPKTTSKLKLHDRSNRGWRDQPTCAKNKGLLPKLTTFSPILVVSSVENWGILRGIALRKRRMIRLFSAATKDVVTGSETFSVVWRAMPPMLRPFLPWRKRRFLYCPNIEKKEETFMRGSNVEEKKETFVCNPNVEEKGETFLCDTIFLKRKKRHPCTIQT